MLKKTRGSPCMVSDVCSLPRPLKRPLKRKWWRKVRESTIGEQARAHRNTYAINNHFFQLPLGFGPLNNALVHRVRRHQAQDQHSLFLANTVAAVLRLQVDLGVLQR